MVERMKDPLQINYTPYEILGIEEDADNGVIEIAFKKGILSGRDVQKLTFARKTLLEPVERAFVDIFLYDEIFIRQLVPRVWNDNSLLVTRRAQIAKVWGSLHKKLFPYTAASHSLAVLWYWWAYYCEEEQLAKKANVSFNGVGQISGTPHFDDLWENAIAHWVYLINCEDFWNTWSGTKNIGDDIGTFREKIEGHFINCFLNLIEKYQNIDDPASVDRFYKYEYLFSAELKTAKELSKQHLRLTKGERTFVVYCGKRMLQEVELLDNVHQQLDMLKEKHPQDFNLERLSLLFSPFFYIFILLENKKFDEAIHAIEALPSELRTDREALKLLVTAYLEKGKQQFSLDLYDEALSNWKKAVDVGENTEEVKKTIVDSCKSKGASLQRCDPDTAIKILQRGLELTADTELKEILSVIYCQRGVDRILEAQKDLKNNPDDKKAKNEIKEGVEDLKRAVKLDPSNLRATNQLKIAKDILSDLDFIDVIEYMNTKQLEKAIDRLEAILAKDSKNKRAQELLEICNSQMCHYCKSKKNRPDESSVYEVKMHRVTYRTHYQMGWQTTSVPIPRCKRCKDAHTKTKKFAHIGVAVGALLGLGPCVFLNNDGYSLGGLLTLGFFVAIFAVVGYGIGRLKFRKNVKSENNWHDAHIIKQAQAEGWVLGEKPPEAQ